MLPEELLQYLCLFLSVVDLQLFSHVNQEWRKIARMCYRHCWEPCDVQRDLSYQTEIRLVWHNVLPNLLVAHTTYPLKQVYVASKACQPPVRWPTDIHTLRLPLHLRSLQGYTLPRRLHTLILGTFINEPLDQVTWPVGLKKLVLGYHFDHPLTQLPEELEELCLGRHFCSIHWHEIQWPRTLQTLDLRYHPWPEVVPLPSTLKRLILTEKSFRRHSCHYGKTLPSGLRVELVG